MTQSSTLRHSPPSTARGQQTRQKLLRAAESVFGDRAFDEASISEITGRAGVAQGTFYVYFPDKKSIYVELVDDIGARLRHALGEATSGMTERLEIERAGLRAFFEFTRVHRSIYRIVRQSEFVDQAAFRRYYLTLAGSYAGALKRAMTGHQVRKMDPEVLAFSLMGLADLLGMRWVLWEEQPDVDRVVDEAMCFISDGLRPPAPLPRSGKAHRQPPGGGR